MAKKAWSELTDDEKSEARGMLVTAAAHHFRFMPRRLERFISDDAAVETATEQAWDKYGASGPDGAPDWSSFFASLLTFLQGLMTILGPLIFKP